MNLTQLLSSIDVTPNNFKELRASLDSNKDKFRLESYYRGKYCNRFKSATEEHLLESNNMWFKNKTLFVFSEKGVVNSDAETVVRGTKNAINQVGLDLDVKYVGVHPTFTKQVEFCRDNISKRVDAHKLGDILHNEPYRQPGLNGFEHGDVIILNSPVRFGKGSCIITGSHGIGNFSKGFAINWISSQNVSTHEAGHLLGIPNHRNHGEKLNHWIPEFVSEYDTSFCVMNWSAPTDRFCDHCLDRLTYLWKGLEKATGIAYFK